jgi:hypothetical protein
LTSGVAGQGPDVTDAAFVHMTGAGVVDCVFSPPAVIGREGEHAGEKSNEVVERSRPEIGAVAASMEDNKNSHQKRSRLNSKRDPKPPGDREALKHQIPEQYIRA